MEKLICLDVDCIGYCCVTGARKMASIARAGIYDLPSDVLLSIFSFLPVRDLVHCAAVCEQWHGIVTGFTHLWKGKTYYSRRSPKESAETRAVLHALPPFRDVFIETVPEFDLVIFYPCLTLSMIDIGVVQDYLRLRCEYLSTRLDVVHDILSNRLIVDFAALRKLRILRSVTPDERALSGCSVEYVVSSALELCPNLSELSVCADYLSANHLDALEGISQLRTLEIECPGLEKLSFLRHCSGGLEELQLVGCVSLPSQEFVALRGLGNLRRLRLNDCRFAEGDLAMATAALSALESLQLNRCGRIRDLSILQNCSQLRELCITNLSEPDAMLTVTPAGERMQFRQLRRPADALRSVLVVGVTVTVTDDELFAALTKLVGLGLDCSCLKYFTPLLHCCRLRHICCEFVREPDEPELLFIRRTYTSEALDEEEWGNLY